MGHLFGEHQRERSHIKASSSSLCPTQKMEGWRRLPQWALPAFLALLILLPEGNDSKTSRVRTNYKLRVGDQTIGRYTPYSQVRIRTGPQNRLHLCGHREAKTQNRLVQGWPRAL